MMHRTVNYVWAYDLPLASVDPEVCGGYTECDPSPGVKCGSELYCSCNSHAVWTFVDILVVGTGASDCLEDHLQNDL